MAAIDRADESAVHGAIPQAGFHHTTLVVLASVAVQFVGTSEDERPRADVERCQFVWLTCLHTAVEEGHEAILLVQGHGHLSEATPGNRRVRNKLLLVDHSLQFVVLGQPQLQFLSVGAVREQRHVASCVVGLYHQVDGQVLAAEVTAGIALDAALAVELHTDVLRDAVVVHLALHFEVGDSREVVVLDILREVEDDVVAGGQQSALWLRRAEQLRTARILDAGNDLRRCGEEVAAVAAEHHGPQVVGTLGHPAFAIEPGHDVAVGLHQFPHAVGTGHQCRVGIVRAEVRPGIVATLRLLILELNMIEVVLVAVEAVDGDRYVPAALRINLCIGVQHPLVVGHGNVDAAGLTQEVHVEC